MARQLFDQLNAIENKTAVITGGNSGIGLALVQELLLINYYVVVLDLESDQINKIKNHRLFFLAGDVVKEKTYSEVAQFLILKKLELVLWINSAGLTSNQAFKKTTMESFLKIMEVNFNGVVLGTHWALKILGPKAGFIVNMASIGSDIPAPLMAAYTSSKFAVDGFSRTIQLELLAESAQQRVLIVKPGFVKTPLIGPFLEIYPQSLIAKIMQSLASEPTQVAKEIIQALKGDKMMIYPTKHGKVLKQIYRLGGSLIDQFNIRQMKKIQSHQIKNDERKK